MASTNLDTGSFITHPEAWYYIGKGSGLYEYQGFDDWTAEEQDMFDCGRLRCKYGFGQVTVRLPIQTWKQGAAVAYGFLPFLIPVWWLLWIIMSWISEGKPRRFPLFGISMAVGFAIGNELVTKQICKRFLSPEVCSRPAESVCKHPGMPSGHVMNAYTLMVWVLLEAIFDSLPHFEWLLIVVAINGLVPWARVYNKDHTVPQVLVSAVWATILGCIAFIIRKSFFGHLVKPW